MLRVQVCWSLCLGLFVIASVTIMLQQGTWLFEVLGGLAG